MQSACNVYFQCKFYIMHAHYAYIMLSVHSGYLLCRSANVAATATATATAPTNVHLRVKAHIQWRCGPYKNQPCVNPMQRTNEDGQCVVPREQFDRFTTTHGRALASASGAWTKTALKSTTGQTASAGGLTASSQRRSHGVSQRPAEVHVFYTPL